MLSGVLLEQKQLEEELLDDDDPDSAGEVKDEHLLDVSMENISSNKEPSNSHEQESLIEGPAPLSAPVPTGLLVTNSIQFNSNKLYLNIMTVTQSYAYVNFAF